eukprot:scaffold746_cov123-Cylindrotheca_fusiformis.AAC.22
MRVHENSQVTCKDIYLDLGTLNKSTNRNQCLQKTTQYRSMCCTASPTSSDSHTLSLIAGLLLFAGFVRRIFSSRRIRTAPQHGDEESVDEISIDYADMEDGGDSGAKPKRDSKHTESKKKSCGSKIPSEKTKGCGRKNDTLFSLQSTIKSLISTPPHRKKQQRRTESKEKRKVSRKENIPLQTQLV